MSNKKDDWAEEEALEVVFGRNKRGFPDKELHEIKDDVKQALLQAEAKGMIEMREKVLKIISDSQVFHKEMNMIECKKSPIELEKAIRSIAVESKGEE